MYRDAERKKALADRIRQAWEQSGHTEQHIAEAMGITVSGFQKQKQSGGITRENLEILARETGVALEWLQTGRGKGPTPDLVEKLGDNGAVDDELRDQLDRIEAMLADYVQATLPIILRLSGEEPGEQAPGSEASDQ